MTRTYAAKRLLEHGALTFREFVQITGWSAKQAWTALDLLDKAGLLEVTGAPRRQRYGLAA